MRAPHVVLVGLASLVSGGSLHAAAIQAPSGATQGTDSAESALEEGAWSRLSGLLDLLRTLEGDAALEIRPPASSCGVPAAATAEQEAFNVRADATKRDPGLDLEAGLRSDFVDQPIDEGLPGAYVGLSFELLQSGLLENRKLADVLRVRAEQAGVRALIDDIRQANLCWVDAAEPYQVPLRRALLEAKAEAMRELETQYRRAYFSGSVYLDDVLESEQEVLRTRTELQALPAPSGPGELTPPSFPAVFDLDLDEAIGWVETDELSERLRALREKEARLSRELDDDTRLRLYVRYGVRPDDAGQSRNGVSGGVVFRKPLFQDRDAGLGPELEAERLRTEAQREERLAATRFAYERFHDQLVRTVRQHYLYLENFERVRRSNATWTVDPGAADLATALNRLTDLYNSALDRAAALRELYRAAAQVFVVSGQPYDATLLRPMRLPGPDYRGREGTRALYVWSESFNRLDNGYLLELLRAKGFQRAVVSVGRGVDPDKLQAFRSRAESSGTAVELMLSTNSWLRPENRTGVSERVAGLDMRGDGLHLDVEPQALEGFQEDQESRLAEYFDLVERARNALEPSVPLSVSVPIWWPASAYARLATMADRIYLMAYGETDAERLIERLAPPLRGADPDRLVLALRASDFESEWELDVLYDQVSEATGIRDAAIHDLGGFLILMDAPE